MNKGVILGTVRAFGGYALARKLTAGKLRILCYHGVWTLDEPQYGDRLFMPTAKFEDRMKWLSKSAYLVLPLDEAVDMLAEDRVPDGGTVITIDDGWASTYTHMLPMLEALRLPASLYVATYYVENDGPVANVAVDYIIERAAAGLYDLSDIIPELAAPIALGDPASRDAAGNVVRPLVDDAGFESRCRILAEVAERFGVGTEPWWNKRQFHLMRPEQLQDAARRGFDVQLHTHRHKGLASGIDHLPQELADNRASLTRILGDGERDHFCYPSGGYDAGSETMLAAAGIKSATLVDEGLNAPGTDPYQLRRFLDGSSVTLDSIDAYLSGALDIAGHVR